MSGKRKYKSNYYKAGGGGGKKARYGEELKPGLKGFLITCGGNERYATIEAYRILNEYADKKYGTEQLSEDGNNPDQEDIEEDVDDIEGALNKQVKDIKKMNSRGTVRRFQSVQNKSKNVVFIKTTLETPGEFLLDIFNDILETKIKKTKVLLRFLPVIDTCHAKFDHITKQAQPIIEKYFHNAKESFSFCIMWKVRCNNTLKKEEVVTSLVKYIMSDDKIKHTIDYKTPDIVFNLDIVGNICCFGIVKDFYKYKKYNIDILLDATPEKPVENVDDAVKSVDDSVIKVADSVENVKKSIEEVQDSVNLVIDSVKNVVDSVTTVVDSVKTVINSVNENTDSSADHATDKNNESADVITIDAKVDDENTTEKEANKNVAQNINEHVITESVKTDNDEAENKVNSADDIKEESMNETKTEDLL